jgi:class 3 adenylate cyclase/predicted ATPase
MTFRQPDRGSVGSASRNEILGASEPERRQLTVMFCDLVGYTVLSQQIDPEDLQEILQLFRDTCIKIIEKYNGYICRYMGDAILVLFGYPAAQENDAERAVHAALDITTAVYALKVPDHDLQLSVHTGIATGLVVAGDVIGTGPSREEEIVGETPSLAARLQGLAKPNAVVIAETTRKLLRDAFECRSLGKHTLKGFKAPVTVWQVIGPREVESRFDAARTSRLPPLVDRHAEFDHMWRLWNEAKVRSSWVLLLCGEPGIGKSRLAKALRDRVESEPHVSVQFQCSPYYRNTALYPFARQIERAAGFERDDSDGVRVEKLRALFGEELLPVFARLTSVPMRGGKDISQLSAQRQKDLTFTAMLEHLSALARERPVLATIEDVHWMDPTSLELITFVIDRIGDARVLFVVTFRPEFSPPWTARPNASSLILSGLAQAYGEALARNVLGRRRASRDIIAQVVGKTGGVPLFIEELTKSLVESGVLSGQAGRRARSESLPVGAIPVTLMDSLMARIDQLGEAKRIAQIGAVIGQEFTLSLMESITQEPEAELRAALERLVSSGLALRQVSATDTRYFFKHSLVRDAAYNSVLRRRREKIHARIAECLETYFPEIVANEPELLAHHCSRAGMTEKAIRYWQMAGQRASERSANLEAASHLANAFELLDHLPDALIRRELELSLLITLGPVEIAIKGSGSEKASETYARAVALCAELPDSPLHFAAYWGQWRTSKNYLTKRERADKLSAVADNLGDPGLRLQAHHCQWASLFNLGFQHQCCQHIERGLQLYESGDFRWHASVYGGHDPAVCGHGEAALSLWLLGLPQQAMSRIDQALAIADSLSHAGSTAHAVDIALMLHRFRQDVPEVYARSEQLISLSEHEGFAAHRAKGKMFRGWALSRLGDVERGIAGLNEGLDALRAIATNEDLPVFLEMLAECYAMSGQTSEGLRALDAAFAEAEAATLRYWLAELFRRKGELLLQAPDRDQAQAESCFTDALRIARQQDASSVELRAATSYARLLRRRGEEATAYTLLSPIYHRFTEGFDTVDLAAARACLEELKPSVALS